jgi:putative inorganic carbon (HCO3(-)) transporter
MTVHRGVMLGHSALQLGSERRAVQIALSVLVGFLGGGSILIDVPLKWRAAFIMALGFAVLLLMVRNTRRVLLLILTFVVPLYVGRDFFSRPEHVGELNAMGIYLIDVLVVVLLMIYLARLAIRQARVQFFAFTTVPALAWLVATGFSLANARDTDIAAIQMIAMGKLFLLYLVVANSVEDGEDVKWVVGGLFLGVLCQALLGSYQGITKHPLGLSFLGETPQLMQQRLGQRLVYRPQGTLSQPNDYAMYLSTAMPFALALLFSRVRRLYKAAAGIVLCVGVLGSVFSLSRGGWIDVVIGIAVVLMLASRRRRLKIHNSLLIAGAILSILLVLTISRQDLIVGRLTTDDKGSAFSRVVLAEGSLVIIQDYPLLGVGLNNYTLFMPQYDRASFQIWQGPAVVHNIFLLITAETGLIGLAAFLLFLASLVIQAWRLVSRAPNDTLWMAGVGIFSAYIVLILHNMVDYALLANLQLFTQFWLLAGVAAGLSRELGHEKRAPNRFQFYTNVGADWESKRN